MRTKHPLPRGLPEADSRLGMRIQAPQNMWSCPEATEGYNAFGPNFLICLQLPALVVESDGPVKAFSRIRAAGPAGLRAPLPKWGLPLMTEGPDQIRKEIRTLEDTDESSRRRATGGREAGFQGRPASSRLNVCAAHQQFHGNPGDFTLRREM